MDNLKKVKAIVMEDRVVTNTINRFEYHKHVTIENKIHQHYNFGLDLK